MLRLDYYRKPSIGGDVKKDEQRPTLGVAIKTALGKTARWIQSTSKRLLNRGSAANVLMIAFIIMTSVGAWQIYPPIGFIVGGVGCGIFGFILGLD